MVNEDLEYLQAQALDNAAFGDTLVNTDVVFRSLARGERYTFRHLFQGVADGSTVRVFANLPSGADAAVSAGTRNITATAQVDGATYANVTQDTAGTAQMERNDRISPDTQTMSELEWETGGTYSNLGEGSPFLTPGGTGGASTGSTGVAASARVEPGANLLWEITSRAADNDILFTVTYTENAESQ